MACSSAEGCGVVGKAWRLALVVASALLAPAVACAADIETRDFIVFVSGKRSGEVHMTIHRKDKGLVEMRCDTDIKVSTLLFTYKYSYRGQETWKDNRLVKFDSNTDDNGTRYVVSAVAEAGGVRLTVNNAGARMVKPEVWLSSYWALPDAKLRNQLLPIIDADNGKNLDGRLQFIANERRSVAGQVVALNHYRLAGKATVDLWYDGADRLVRQEWVEQGHRTILELNRVRK